MTGSKVLIVKLPELHADVKQLEAFRSYVCDALGVGNRTGGVDNDGK